MTTNQNLTHRQTITVRMSKQDSAGGLISDTELVEVIYLQHSKRMPGFLQIDNQGAIQYVPESSLVIPTDWSADGATCFKLGYSRIVPRAILVEHGVEAARSWYAGWDAANLAAPVEEVHRYLYRWGRHSGAVYAASTEEARRVIEASGISATSECFIEMVLTD